MKGEFRILFLYEVAEAIRLDSLRSLLVPGGVQPSIGLTPPIPHYLHFERSPVVEAIHPMVLKAGEQIEGKTNYYDYGVVSIELELPFECDWALWFSNPVNGSAQRNSRTGPLKYFALL